MKDFQKMTTAEFLSFMFMSISSGLMIGIGGTASLLSISLFQIWGKLIGALLFSLGIFAIVTYEMKLFTGMVADIPKMGIKNIWKLPFCFLGNILGVGIIALLVSFTPLAEKVIPQAQEIVAQKLSAPYWGASALCSSILCGALITLSVWSVKYSPRKGLDATLGVTFPIVVFAFCGFDHSVANVLYFCFYGQFTWQIIGYELICMLGNIIGGVILPLIVMLRDYAIMSK